MRESATQPSANSIIAISIILIATWAVAIGYIYPATALNLENRGASASLIGWMGAMTGFGILANAWVLPRIISAWGRWKTAAISVAALALVVFGFGLTENIIVWFVLRFLIGFTNNAVFVVCETWINEAADDKRRGRIIAVYTSVIALTFACGPLLIPVVGVSGLTAYGTVAGIIIVVGLPMWLLRHMRDTETERTGTFALYKKVILLLPMAMIATSVFAWFDGATLSLWVVYAQDRGLTENAASLSLTALIIGNAILQVPIGWLADFMPRRLLVIILSAIMVAGSAVLHQIDIGSWLGTIFLFIWGACAFGVYTLALVIIGQRLKGSELIAANAAFGVLWGIFALAGSAVAGIALDYMGTIGLPLVLGLAYLILLIAAATTGSTRVPDRP